MTLKDDILRELQASDADVFLDTQLKSTAYSDVLKRRQILFELANEGKIKFKDNKQIKDSSFPLIIIDWEGRK